MSEENQDLNESEDNLDDESGMEFDEGQETDHDDNQDAGDAGDDQSDSGDDIGDEGDQGQENINEAINKQHKKFRDEEREKLRLQDELNKAKAELATVKGDEYQIVDVPDMPGEFDDEYDKKVAERDEIIKNNAIAAAQIQNREAAQVAEQEAEAGRQLQELNTRVQNYSEKATELGVTPEDLQNAANVVAQYGISFDLTNAILGDADGPLITKHLASNPVDIDTLSRMDLYSAANYINQTIRPKLAELRPAKTNAKKPAKQVKGKGSDYDNKKYPDSKGMTFE